jgi:hypothetical protein
MITECLILWLVLWFHHLLFLWRSLFIYCHTKIKIIFGFSLAVHEAVCVSDIDICYSNHHDFLNPSLGGHWTRVGVGPKVWSEMISSIQSLSHPSTDWAISWLHQSHYYYYYYYYRRLFSQAFSSWYFSWTSGDPHRSGFKLHTAVLSVLCVMFQV